MSSKRRRTMKRAPISTASPSFGDIFDKDGDTGVACLSFLTSKDLNEFVMVSKLARLCRNNPELDQSRQGKISIAQRSNLSQIEFCQRLVGEWGHQRPLEKQRSTRTLCLEGMGNFSRSAGFGTTDPTRSDMGGPYVTLPDVEELLLRCSLTTPTVQQPIGSFLCQIFPNLCVLDLTGVFVDPSTNPLIPGESDFFGYYAEACPKIHTIICRRANSVLSDMCNRGRCGVDITGEYVAGMTNLRVLDLQGASMDTGEYQDDERNPRLLLHVRDRLVEVNLKGADHSWRYILGDFKARSELITQEQLADFVRNAPKLKLFRSDLSATNVRKLKEERPDVIFV